MNSGLPDERRASRSQRLSGFTGSIVGFDWNRGLQTKDAYSLRVRKPFVPGRRPVAAEIDNAQGPKVVSLDRKCLGASRRICPSCSHNYPRGIFDKETRRKAVAVVGAAMEPNAR
jgi:hypothetical protein